MISPVDAALASGDVIDPSYHAQVVNDLADERDRYRTALERIGGELVRRNMSMRREDVQALWAIVAEAMPDTARKEDRCPTADAGVAASDIPAGQKESP